jgi:Uma2 family endonuclease
MRTDIKFTYNEYKALPEGPPYHQLIEGELILSPAPDWKHSTIVARLLNNLFSFVDSRRLGEVRTAPVDVHLSEETIVQPDILYVSKSRNAIIKPDGVHGAPDLCIEVLSSKPDLDREIKRVLYAQFGVNEYWIVDPDRRTVDVFKLQADAVRPLKVLGDSDTLTTDLLPELQIALSSIFAE